MKTRECEMWLTYDINDDKEWWLCRCGKHIANHPIRMSRKRAYELSHQ